MRTQTHTYTHTHTALLKQYHVVLDPFVLSLCPVCKEIWADVCDGRDPSRQTMAWLKGGFFLFSLWSLLVRCKFTWPFNSSPHKLVSFIQRLLLGHIRRHCCPGLSNRPSPNGALTCHLEDTRPQQQRFMWQHAATVYLCLPVKQIQNTYLGKKKKRPLMFVKMWAGLS